MPFFYEGVGPNKGKERLISGQWIDAPETPIEFGDSKSGEAIERIIWRKS